MIENDGLTPRRDTLSLVADALCSDTALHPPLVPSNFIDIDTRSERPPIYKLTGISPRLHAIAETINTSLHARSESPKCAELLEQLMTFCREHLEAENEPLPKATTASNKIAEPTFEDLFGTPATITAAGNYSPPSHHASSTSWK
jgi:hypothetical protein